MIGRVDVRRCSRVSISQSLRFADQLARLRTLDRAVEAERDEHMLLN
jgi:hypothetical protein